MRLLIASDIHGSEFFMRALSERITEEAPERVILLGDILYHGPRNDLPKDYSPKGVIALFEEIKTPVSAVTGNCDSEVDDMVLPFSLRERVLRMKDEKFNLIFHHGHHEIKTVKGDIIFSGHTHVPLFKEENGRIYVNPGSVSIPKEESHHGYIIYEDGACLFKDVTSGEIIRTEVI